jgi:hypothetical protein
MAKHDKRKTTEATMESVEVAEAPRTDEAPPVVEQASVEAAPEAVAMPAAEAAEAEASTVSEPMESESSKSETAEAASEPEPQGRDRIQQQLEQLKQREAELRRELAMADHPGLADAIRSIEGRAYGVTRVEAKMAAGLSKAEHRRKETLEKKLASALEKRAEIDTQIAALELELAPLGEARVSAFAVERAEALRTLADMLREHEASLSSAQVDILSLVPALGAWQSELAQLRANA